MKARHWGIAALGLGALLLQQPASAEILVGGGAGVSQLSKYSDVDDGFAWRAFVAYRASEFPLYFEAQYFDSGELDIDSDGFEDVTLEFDGYTAAVGYRVVLDDYGSDLLLKGGGYVQDSRAEGPGGNLDDDGSGGLLGVGGNWMFTPHLGLNFDVQFLFGVKDFADDENLTLATVGLIYSFYAD